MVRRDGIVKSRLITRLTAKNIKSFINENVDTNSMIITDEFRSYNGLNKYFNNHFVINHGRKEYVRGEIRTNTIEGYFSLLKRGITGAFHHVSKKYLHRYLNEFDFRYNMRKVEDATIATLLLGNIEGKKLFYWDSSVA